MAIISFFIYRVSSSLINRLIVCRNVFCFIFFFFFYAGEQAAQHEERGNTDKEKKTKKQFGNKWKFGRTKWHAQDRD